MNKLSQEEKNIIINKGTEYPHSGKFNNYFEEGTYICKQCGAALYLSSSKFHSTCGWPSFDEEIEGAVKHTPDPDGERVEIQCSKCKGHLGHVFEGEHLTEKNVRHCVNSLSMDFVPKERMGVIVLGGGCFWCTEAVFSLVPGVLNVSPGYAGGVVPNPNYKQICSGKTGHAEVIRIVYDKGQTSLEKILEHFFSIHDPTTLNKQGNDIGTQYRSLILYSDEKEKTIIEDFIKKVQNKFESKIVTEVKKLEEFFYAEEYHKNYYNKNSTQPYCMLIIKPKIEKISHSLSGGQ